MPASGPQGLDRTPRHSRQDLVLAVAHQDGGRTSTTAMPPMTSSPGTTSRTRSPGEPATRSLPTNQCRAIR
jgi:hypothetical protein